MSTRVNYPKTLEEWAASMEGRGYGRVEKASLEGAPELTVGDRVHNRGQQYIKAYWHGTARVLALFEKPDSHWARTWDLPDGEVIVQTDDGRVAAWAYHGTRIPDRALSWCVLDDGHDGYCYSGGPR